MSVTSLFRIAKKEHLADIKTALSGEGGVHTHGRWHLKGYRVTYFSSSRALSLLEKLTNLDVHPSEMAWPFAIAGFAIDSDFLEKNTLEITREDLDRIDQRWQLPRSSTCLKLGTTWYRDSEFLFLKVPSAVVPDEYNFVLNSSHSAVLELAAQAEFDVSNLSLDRRIAEVLDREALAKRKRQN